MPIILSIGIRGDKKL
ncbi:UNVERIFIED_CONTAM: hypothetical protein GTU68_010400 [Idotea baltica]|nr:hypothetical protein [Idotea baltica]